ncbi:MAG: Gldg family protein [Microscillaceae bacterium]|nr:Gldg family protein [Microscillaceae bacterium]
MKKKALNTTIFLVLGILVLINLLSEDLYFRGDFTEGGQYTLSPVTKEVLKNLQEPITVKAYFSRDLHPQLAKNQRDFKDMLTEYANLSGNNIQYQLINPSENEQLEQEAVQSGIRPILVEVRDKNAMKQQKAYMGAVLQLGEQKEVLPVLQQGTELEYALTTSIKKLTALDKPSIAFLQGHGEPALQELGQAYQALSVLYTLEPLTLNDSTAISPKYRTIAVVAPRDTLPPNHLRQLDDFLGKGGKILLALNRVDGDLGGQTPTGVALGTGLEPWLAKKGVRVEQKFIIDAACSAINVQQQQGPFTFVNQIQFPFIPIIQTFAKHPITEGLEALILPFASPLRFDASKNPGVRYTPIAFSSSKSDTLPAPQYFDLEKEWADADFKQKNIAVAAILEGKLGKGDSLSRMVIIGDGDFPVNGQGEQQRQLNEDNINLLVNGIDWLSDDTGLIELRTKAITSRPLSDISEATQNLLRYFNFLFPIILVLGYGLYRRQRRLSIRQKREKESFLQ